MDSLVNLGVVWLEPTLFELALASLVDGFSTFSMVEGDSSTFLTRKTVFWMYHIVDWPRNFFRVCMNMGLKKMRQLNNP